MQINSPISIQTGSRLHFGLLSFGWPDRRQFGGLGLMTQRPGVRLDLHPAAEFTVDGPLAPRVREFALAWTQNRGLASLPACKLHVVSVAPQHAGLGTGTQLGLAVAAVLTEFHGGTRPAAVELAALVGRGLRSSVGTYGFELGGLIYEDGKAPGETIGRLRAHVELPPEWRVVLIFSEHADGLSGEEEVNAFSHLSPVPTSVTERLQGLIEDKLLPAACLGNLVDFGEHLYIYGREAGMCFASCQGGPYASPQLESWVSALRRRGYVGVGQSSWGPTLFVVVSSEEAARQLIDWFQRDIAPKAGIRVRLEATAVSYPGPSASHSPRSTPLPV